MSYAQQDGPGPGGWWSELRTALGFLTRLRTGAAAPVSLAAAAWAFPVVGLAVGLAGALAYAIAIGLDLPAGLAALLAVATTVLVTGALHEDGFADMADGFGGGAGRAEKLAIMRDSRTGNFGALALVFSVAARLLALAALGTPGLVAAALLTAHAGSRAALVAVMHREPLAREDGLAVEAGRPSRDQMLWAAVIAAAVALAALGIGGGLIALAIGALAGLAMVGLARRQIGGQTGDVLGAVQQAVEIAMLAAIAAWA